MFLLLLLFEPASARDTLLFIKVWALILRAIQPTNLDFGVTFRPVSRFLKSLPLDCFRLLAIFILFLALEKFSITSSLCLSKVPLKKSVPSKKSLLFLKSPKSDCLKYLSLSLLLDSKILTSLASFTYTSFFISLAW